MTIELLLLLLLLLFLLLLLISIKTNFAVVNVTNILITLFGSLPKYLIENKNVTNLNKIFVNLLLDYFQ